MDPQEKPGDADYVAAHRALAQWRQCGCAGCGEAARALQDKLDAASN